jgi:cobalamin biosynthetic protein CobC
LAGTALFHRHGGRLSDAERAWPDAPRPWLDLSTGINPKPWRGRVAWDRARLPDPASLAALEAAAAQAFGVRPDRVAATAGADTALRLLPELLEARSVAIVSPTYGGHAQAWAGRDVREIAPASLPADGADAAVVVNPNNPDGRILAAADMGLESGRTLVIDESFAEATPEMSLASKASDRLIVLRSFGKFYGLPGVRLGFVVASADLAARVRNRVGDWPVTAEAIAVGIAAYSDAAWAERARVRLARDAQRLDRLLVRAGFSVTGDCSLFRLAFADDAQARFERLAAQGVLVRPFSHTPNALRFGLPPAGGWARLAAALEASHGR